MPSSPIRAVLVHKQKRRKARAKGKAAGREEERAEAPPELGHESEMMAALRATPRAASLARAQRALGRHYRIDLLGEADGGLDSPTPGMRVLHFELTGDGHGMDFKSACAKALCAMRLTPKSLPDCIPLVYPPSPSCSASGRESMPLSEQIEWFRQSMGDILRASSARLEGLSISRSCGHRQASVRSSWL